MKKISAFILVMLMLLTLSACAKDNKDTEKETEPAEELAVLEGVEVPIDILNTVYENYTEEEKSYFQVPSEVDFEDENMPSILLYDDTAKAMVESAAMYKHPMLTNNLCIASYRLTEGSDVKEFSDIMEEKMLNNQWMCGIPEKIIVVSLGEDYVVVGYGMGENIDTVVSALRANYETAEVLAEKPLV